MYLCMDECMYVCVYVCVYICMYGCICMYIHVCVSTSDLSPSKDAYSHQTELSDARIISLQPLPSGDVMIGLTYSAVSWTSRMAGITMTDAWVYTPATVEHVMDKIAAKPVWVRGKP